MRYSRKTTGLASLLASAAIASIATPSVALAQDTEVDDEAGDEDRPVIIVTGTKQNKSLQKVEASVAVVTQESIE